MPAATALALAALALAQADAAASDRYAASEHATDTAPDMALLRQPSPAPPSPPGVQDTWIDRSHLLLERGVMGSVTWFDRFFGDPRAADLGRNGTVLRWQNELRLDDGGPPTVRTGLRADLSLPRLESWLDRARLVIYAESRADPDRVVPEDPANPALSPPTTPATSTAAGAGTVAAELRYDALRSMWAHVDLGLGVRADVPPEPFVRSRFRTTVPLGPTTQTRFTVAGWYDLQQGFGHADQAELEQQLGRAWLARWTNVAVRSEVSQGWEWGSEAALLWQFTPRRALSFSAGVGGATAVPAPVPASLVTLYRLALRLRRDVWRRWVFFEVEPDLAWRQDVPNTDRRCVAGLTFRIEAFFDAADDGAADPVQASEVLPQSR